MKRLFFIYIMVYLSGVMFAQQTTINIQNTYIDSLQTVLDNYLKTNQDTVIQYAEDLEKFADKSKFPLLQARALNALGSAHYYKSDFRKAAKFFEKEVEILTPFSDSSELADSYFNIGTLYFQEDKKASAIQAYKKSLEYAAGEKSRELQMQIYERLAQLYERMNRYKLALENYRLYIETNESKKTEEVENQLLSLRRKYSVEVKKQEKVIREKEQEIEKKQVELQVAVEKEDSLKFSVQKKEEKIAELHIDNIEKDIENKEQEETIESQKKRIYQFAIGLLVVLLYLFQLFRQYKAKIKANRELAMMNQEIRQQKEEIEAQRDEIESQRDYIVRQNKDITDSINYASQIQDALIPRLYFEGTIVKEHFVFFRPRDIVSGDFYWFANVGDYTVVAAADCTGHGVPGAFMSMLGMTFLDEIVNKGNIIKPDEILGRMRKEVIVSLKQKGEEGKSKDGMDMSLVAINNKTRKLYFSGANNPLYLVNNGELTEIKANKMPVAYYLRMDAFTLHEIDLEENTRIYLFSDGFPDQFGGIRGKKYKYKPFKELLVKNSHLDMVLQEQVLSETFDSWKENYEQVDDVIVIGIKV